MRRRDLSRMLLATAAGSTLTARGATAQTCNTICYPLTQAESGVAVVDQSYPPGHVYRYGSNTNPGTTNMTSAINVCANVCRLGGYTLLLPPDTCFVTGSLDFSRITVRGTDSGGFSGPHIQASAADFHVITSNGNSTFSDFYVDGGWDGASTALAGDIFHFDGTGTNPANVAYNIHLRNVRMTHAKQRAIYWYLPGYSSVSACASNNSGSHVVELHGTTGVQATTVKFDGSCTFSDAPNGYGMKLTEFVSIGLSGVIMENTRGIQLNGVNNRALTLIDVYQEGTSGGKFLSSNESSGIGLIMMGCYGAVIGMDDILNWQDVHILGNAAIAASAIPLTGRIQEAISDELATSITGGVNVTAVSLPLGVGTWRVNGEVQIADAGGLSSTLVLASRLTTSSTSSGLANATNSNFEVGADTSGAARSSDRSRTYKIVRLTAPATIYLRAYFNFASGTLAYKGHLYAELLQ
jgi:hypothetical protein